MGNDAQIQLMTMSSVVLFFTQIAITLTLFFFRKRGKLFKYTLNYFLFWIVSSLLSILVVFLSEELHQNFAYAFVILQMTVAPAGLVYKHYLTRKKKMHWAYWCLNFAPYIIAAALFMVYGNPKITMFTFYFMNIHCIGAFLYGLFFSIRHYRKMQRLFPEVKDRKSFNWLSLMPLILTLLVLSWDVPLYFNTPLNNTIYNFVASDC